MFFKEFLLAISVTNELFVKRSMFYDWIENF